MKEKNKLLRFELAVCFFLLLFVADNVQAFLAKDTFIRSEGADNGWIALRLTYPSSVTSFRYTGNAPVLVFVPGGFNPGSRFLSPGLAALGDRGIVVISFVFPGGLDGINVKSQGTYDYRGINCIETLRDVLKFAAEESVDSTGKYISQLVGGNVLGSQVGLLAESNGGPIIITTLDLYGQELSFVRYFAGEEDPTSDQLITLDLGWLKYECDTTLIDNTGSDADNVKYISYGNPHCLLDYSTLAYDSLYAMGYEDGALPFQPVTYQAGILFFDNNGDHKVDTTSDGTYCIDGNEKLDAGDDYPFFAIPTFTNGTGIQIHYSMPLLEQATARNILNPSQWPKHIATLSETSAFWSIRDATLHFSNLSTQAPNVHALLIFYIRDHVQTQSDKPHIQQAYDDFRSQGIWTRLNPDTVYLQYILQTTLPSGTPDNDANIPVTPGTIANYSEPFGMLSYPLNSVEAAAVCEMADRTYYNNWALHLSSVITQVPTDAPLWKL